MGRRVLDSISAMRNLFNFTATVPTPEGSTLPGEKKKDTSFIPSPKAARAADALQSLFSHIDGKFGMGAVRGKY
jgi:hypothetical protein